MPVQRRPITPEQYRRLVAIGVLDENSVHLQHGWIVHRPVTFSDEAAAAARRAGIVLDEPPAQSQAAATRDRPAPDDEPARSPEARRLWLQLEAIMLILVEQGGAHFATALSWLAEPDEALEGQSPAAWLAAGRDPETIARLAGRDAARWAQ
jgi:hypothetical protein